MTEIRFVVRGTAVPQGSTRAFVIKDVLTGLTRAVTTNKTKALSAWRTAIAQEARTASVMTNTLATFQLLEGALEVECHFAFMPVKSRKKQGTSHFQRPDIDKLLRAVLDACTGVIWHDDAQVMRISGTKEYKDPPMCEVIIRTC